MKEFKPLRQIFGFPSTVFVTVTVYIQLSVLQVWKSGLQGADADYVTVGELFLHLASRLSVFPRKPKDNNTGNSINTGNYEVYNTYGH